MSHGFVNVTPHRIFDYTFIPAADYLTEQFESFISLVSILTVSIDASKMTSGCAKPMCSYHPACHNKQQHSFLFLSLWLPTEC
jgi:hypothetical protein